MAVKCLNCGYKMGLWQELMSTGTHVTVGAPTLVAKIIKGIYEEWKKRPGEVAAVAGIMNHSIGASKGVRCPKCKEYHRWEDTNIFSRQ